MQLKQCAYRIFLAGVRNDTEIKTYYEEVQKTNGGNKTKARLSTQRKIIKTLWTIWKTGEAYDPKLFVYNHRRPSDEPNIKRVTHPDGSSHLEYQLDNQYPASNRQERTSGRLTE